MRKILSTLCCSLFLSVPAGAGQIDFSKLPEGYPRIQTTADQKDATLRMIRNEAWASDLFRKLQERTDRYAEQEPEWLSSRLRMYWKTHATDVFVKGEFFSHAGGERAPFPTVMFDGARSHATIYSRPKIENLIPYEEEAGGISLHNNQLPGAPTELVSIGKSGRQVSASNMDILNVARDCAFLWWVTGEEKYGETALSVFDTYMTGIYYRNVPRDLNNGHQQTLVGMSSFEVIHEDALSALVPLYDFLHDYIRTRKPEKMAIYDGAFKKWADNIIANGVPHNNWNLFQARFIMDVALILKDNDVYPDGKGRTYYIDYVLNESSIRQWSLKRLADYGFDPQTGIWAECPGYSCTVVRDFVDFINLFDGALKTDMLPQFPILEKAVSATPQYLFPNRMTVGFGDTHPHPLRNELFVRLIQNAQQFGKRDQEVKFTSLLKLFDPEFEKSQAAKQNLRVAVSSFFAEKPLTLDPSIGAARIEDYTTPVFWAPNVSWLVQRNGMDARNSLMVSQNASEGNHMHANGISMELYGKGYPLAPDAGIGLTLYSGLDYLEYYGQFPSHNTVCVDGVSSYPIMKSNHAFELKGCYPEPSVAAEEVPAGVSYSEVSFREPETQADQTRMMSIVTPKPGHGYYVDVFRSRKVKGGDKMHDYFYHNLGQEMELTDFDGNPLPLRPTEELAFAGAHLYAYSYIFDKKSTVTPTHVKGRYTMRMPDGDDISMLMWMKGSPEREIFSALSPMCEGLSRIKEQPYVIKEQPMLTYVARQSGEAWTRPFVTVFEPVSEKEPGTIRKVSYFDAETEAAGFAGIRIDHTDGRTDHVFSQESPEANASYEGMQVKGTYALIGTSDTEKKYFLGNGTTLIAPGIRVISREKGDIFLQYADNKWNVHTTVPCEVRIGKKTHRIEPGKIRTL